METGSVNDSQAILSINTASYAWPLYYLLMVCPCVQMFVHVIMQVVLNK